MNRYKSINATTVEPESEARYDESWLDLFDDSDNQEDGDRSLDDKVCADDLSTILDVRMALMASEAPVHTDVDEAWKQFEARRRPRRFNKYIIATVITAVAAAVLLLLVLRPVAQQTPVRHYKGEVAVLADPADSIVKVSVDGDDPVKVSDADDEAKKVLHDAGFVMPKAGEMVSVGYAESMPQQLTLSIPRGQTFKLVLSDGSEVWLNAGSRIEYPNKFVDKDRIVKLYGEAFFNVKHDPQHPFIVQTDHLQTCVLGTEFNVRSYSASDSRVTLISGRVAVRGNSKDSKYTFINPGTEAILAENNEWIVRKVDTDTYVYWKEGYFYFDDVPLATIMQSIGRWYNVDVVFNNKSLENSRMHFVCDVNSGLDQAIMLLNSMKNAKIVRKGGTVYIN